MNSFPDTPKAAPVPLRVASPAEAAKIREFAAAWVAFEPAAARAEKSKRWQSVIARVQATAETVTRGPLLVCRRTWLDWQTLRFVRFFNDLVPSPDGPDDPEYAWAAAVDCAKMFICLNRGNAERQRRWLIDLASRVMLGGGDAEAAMNEAAQVADEFCRAQLAARAKRHPGKDPVERKLFMLTQRTLDPGLRAGLVMGAESDDLSFALLDQKQTAALIAHSALADRRTAFLGAYAEVKRRAAWWDAQLTRRRRLLDELLPKVAAPEPDWMEARFFQWLFDESILAVFERLAGQKRDLLPWSTPFDVPLFLASPLCWRLWLSSQWEQAEAGPATAGPQRDVLRQLVEHPAKFLRFPNPVPAVAALRRALRPVSDLLEGSQLVAEREAVVAILARADASSDEMLHLLAVYCARRWSGGVSPKIHGRLVARFSTFLRDEIQPQAPEILRTCAVEVGPELRTTFDIEFEKLVAAEEIAQERLETELRQHAEAWRARVPASAATVDETTAGEALGGFLPPSAERGPVVLRYLLNLGEAQPREERIATTWTELEETLEAFCRREGVRVNIPFSSIAHALEHYVWQTPEEKKHVWPERETYGPLELHKIKRGGMRLLVRESAEGLWLHLLQRKDWFLGER